MLNLGAKLLEAGLITKEQAEKALAPLKNPPRQGKKSFKEKKDDNFETFQRKKRLNELKALGKTEQYDVIRRWVERNRLDKEIDPAGNYQKFFFETKEHRATWLTLDSAVIKQVQEGTAQLVSYMSHYGLTHAVVPLDIGEDIGALFPDWLICLKQG